MELVQHSSEPGGVGNILVTADQDLVEHCLMEEAPRESSEDDQQAEVGETDQRHADDRDQEEEGVEELPGLAGPEPPEGE